MSGKVWPKPESRLDIGLRKLRDYRGGAVLSDAEADAVVERLAESEAVRRQLAEALRECSGLTHSWMPLTEIVAEIEKRANAALTASAKLDQEAK